MTRPDPGLGVSGVRRPDPGGYRGGFYDGPLKLLTGECLFVLRSDEYGRWWAGSYGAWRRRWSCGGKVFGVVREWVDEEAQCIGYLYIR